MEDTVNKRIRTFLKANNITVQKFEASIGRTNGYLAHTKSPTANVLSEIASTYPNLSLDWLITGQGEMYKSDSVISEVEDTFPIAAEQQAPYGKDAVVSLLKEQLSAKEREIGELREEIGELKSLLKQKSPDAIEEYTKGATHPSVKGKKELTGKK